MHPEPLLRVLILIAVANGTPVLAKRLFGDRFAWPVDAGKIWRDGNPVLGSSKTLRGIALALLVTTACAPVAGIEWTTGLKIGAAAMLGDVLSSFTKRRLGLAPQSQALGIDQIPESLLPLLACRSSVGLGAIDVVAGVSIFFAAELLISKLLFRLGLRERPY